MWFKVYNRQQNRMYTEINEQGFSNPNPSLLHTNKY